MAGLASSTAWLLIGFLVARRGIEESVAKYHFAPGAATTLPHAPDNGIPPENHHADFRIVRASGSRSGTSFQPFSNFSNRFLSF